MKFSELPLYQAIKAAYAFVDSPRSARWLIDQQKELYMLIVSYMDNFDNGVPYTKTQVMEAWDRFGKGPSVGGMNKNKLTIEVAEAHGEHCFYRGRGLGECNDEIQLDRLIPGDRGGGYSVANCVLSCQFHNGSRGERNVEDYLRSGTLGSQIAEPAPIAPLTPEGTA